VAVLHHDVHLDKAALGAERRGLRRLRQRGGTERANAEEDEIADFRFQGSDCTAVEQFPIEI